MADGEPSRPFSAPVPIDRKLSGDPLPRSHDSFIIPQEDISQEALDNELEETLIKRAKDGDRLAKFQLGQFYFERGIFEKAIVAFERIKSTDFQAKYQLGVMYYDGLGTQAKPDKGVELLKEIAMSAHPDASHLVPHAQYNIGRAYYEGYGVKQSDKEAERWFLMAARDGDPSGSLRSQTVLGMFYSRPGNENLSKAYFWHQEATGNGSVESQGALGVMFEYGIGVPMNIQSAFECLKGAAIRGNVYAQGNLAVHYYKRKLFNKAADVAKSVADLDDVMAIARETECLPKYVAKGISLGSFVYARCLHHGFGVDKDEKNALRFYSRAAQFDMDTAARLHDYMTYGYI
ncbi:LRP2-binding protein [Nematostella vectensis]|uniref:LRP2-binding protein n=1 Tax=Nematostella vectensis TaxID=45351 RepID=UPI0020779490|nr:LRP2-binding protein [Nematostella vectensis]